MGAARELPCVWLDSEEAARYVRVSIRTFRELVQPYVKPAKIGSKLIFHREELDRWVATQMDQNSTETREPDSTTSGSPTKAAGTSSQRAKQIAQELKKRSRKSTHRS